MDWYPTEDEPTKIVKKPSPPQIIKLKPSLTPGTVVILLAGRFKGKRVIFLKQLPSGLLLVTGPFCVNGVPVKRVNQKQVIGTSTKITLPKKLDLAPFTDSYFVKDKAAKASAKEGQEGFFEAADDEKKELPSEVIANQKKLDAALLSVVEKGDFKGYLKSVFSLSEGDRPHLLKF